MERKIEMLRESIKRNPNLTEEFKCNLGTLTDTLVAVYPDYDYSNYERVVESLNLTINNNLNSYSAYNKGNNTVEFNLKKVFDDRIDLQHLFLGELLQIGSGTKNMSHEVEGFNRGLTEAIATTMNIDESMKKLCPLEYTCISIFSKIVDPQVLIDAYMTSDLGNVIVTLESLGITQEEFRKMLNSINKMNDRSVPSNESFVDAEISMINMYQKVVDSKLKNGEITYDDLKERFDDFSEMLIFSKSELITLYPHHDFSSLSGFERVKDTLDKAVVASELVEEEKFVK